MAVERTWAAVAIVACVAVAPLAGEATASHALDPLALAGVEVHRDVPYAAKNPAVTLDVYVPRGGARPRPVLLFFHGGGWIGGNKAAAIPESDPSPHFSRRDEPGRACCRS